MSSVPPMTGGVNAMVVKELSCGCQVVVHESDEIVDESEGDWLYALEVVDDDAHPLLVHIWFRCCPSMWELIDDAEEDEDDDEEAWKGEDAVDAARADAVLEEYTHELAVIEHHNLHAIEPIEDDSES